MPGVVVDCSTVSTETSEAMRAVCDAAGIHFLASPVSGNGKVVAAGKLSLVSSGARRPTSKVRAAARAIGRHVTYVGEGDTARLVKICHNLMLGVVTQ